MAAAPGEKGAPGVHVTAAPARRQEHLAAPKNDERRQGDAHDA
jgi:hypothetical protein